MYLVWEVVTSFRRGQWCGIRRRNLAEIPSVIFTSWPFFLCAIVPAGFLVAQMTCGRYMHCKYLLNKQLNNHRGLFLPHYIRRKYYPCELSGWLGTEKGEFQLWLWCGLQLLEGHLPSLGLISYQKMEEAKKTCLQEFLIRIGSSF